MRGDAAGAGRPSEDPAPPAGVSRNTVARSATLTVTMSSLDQPSKFCVELIPWKSARWMMKKRTTIGSVVMTDAAIK
jgi:hypothetical protein